MVHVSKPQELKKVSLSFSNHSLEKKKDIYKPIPQPPIAKANPFIITHQFIAKVSTIRKKAVIGG